MFELDRQKGKSAYLSATPADGIIAAICPNGIFGTSVPNAALAKNTPFIVAEEEQNDCSLNNCLSDLPARAPLLPAPRVATQPQHRRAAI
jgi:hypothetical protein